MIFFSTFFWVYFLKKNSYLSLCPAKTTSLTIPLSTRQSPNLRYHHSKPNTFKISGVDNNLFSLFLTFAYLRNTPPIPSIKYDFRVPRSTKIRVEKCQSANNRAWFCLRTKTL